MRDERFPCLRSRPCSPTPGPDIPPDLVDLQADSKGVAIQVYRPTGRPKYATATADHDDDIRFGVG